MSNRFYRASLLATTVIAGMAYASPAFAQDAPPPPPPEETATDDQAPASPPRKPSSKRLPQKAKISSLPVL